MANVDMNASAASLPAAVLQSRDALLGEAIPWRDRELTPENLKALLLARLPAAPTGRDVEQLFERVGVEHASRHGDLVQGRKPAGRVWIVPSRPYWLISAFVDGDDRVTSFKVQYLSAI